MSFYVYILASGMNGTLYVGSTDNLAHRLCEHENEERRGFTAKYYVKTLVWFEQHETRSAAFTRERRIKKWNRVWKLELIEKANPYWRDLKSFLA